MNERPTDKPRGPLRALTAWFRRATLAPEAPAPQALEPPAPVPAAPPPPPASAAFPAATAAPSRIGHYAITGTLGQGGMGIVYAARDERLGRAVALKTMTNVGQEENARRRFWREARAAASVNHPNVCPLYEIGEERGELFIAMELLEGESLAERLRQGPLRVGEALPVALQVLAALSALHARGVIHRDLKPSNVFLTPHGVKLLDFGLARTDDSDGARPLDTMANLTHTGMIMGTPRYMAPEQISGEAIDTRSDLFAAGAILFEMLAGRPAFNGRSVVEILHATLHEQPPALTGSPAVAAVDRVIRRALAKRPAERHADADAMAEDLRAVRVAYGDETPTLARALTRLVVLPFRVLKPDPETDFLAFSLPDAIATSLSGLPSLVVRSNVAAARLARGDGPDLKVLAAEADVDRVVLGTLLRAGDQLRATAQLVEAPGGTLLGSHSVQASLGDLFRLQDDLARRVVEALALPLGGTPPPTPDAPRDPGAYELYLRANELGRKYDDLPRALELYDRCLELDPSFAPAWAQLGRAHRVIGKYVSVSPGSVERAENALKRALELNPRLTLAHKYYANLEADTGNSRGAVARLLEQAAAHGNDPELFAGLVHACRYAGLYEPSIAAHREARRLDPNIPTSVEQTVLMTTDLERLLGFEPRPKAHVGGDLVIRVIALGLGGRHDDARAALDELRRNTEVSAFRTWTDYLVAWLDRDAAGMRAARSTLAPLEIMSDPEAIFQEAWLLSHVGETERPLELMQRAVAKGYYVAETLTKASAFDHLRNDPAFTRLLADAETGRRQAFETFVAGGGERLLGR